MKYNDIRSLWELMPRAFSAVRSDEAFVRGQTPSIETIACGIPTRLFRQTKSRDYASVSDRARTELSTRFLACDIVELAHQDLAAVGAAGDNFADAAARRS
jgi:hypothetical protein